MPLTFLRAFFGESRSPSTGDILRNVNPQRLIVAITGATGAIYGVRLLEMLREASIETHLVISRGAAGRCCTKPPTQSIRFSGSRR